MQDALKHNLFSYGTLQLNTVQLENYGRLLNGEKVSLKQYKLDKLKITDAKVLKASGKEFHPIALKTNNVNDSIEGTIFKITEKELIETDKYEVSDYKRILETFSTGKKAWIYIAKADVSKTKNTK
ncbi:gamma-glutamylcyclotransferase family protein [uncultured Lacinutrix sp.]|uniref:gamma-glutamylcyclotransferase family protein n=1 Tax=uncultured Lacinutrix sp. TaxID=574032 RepID=UPI00261D254A|nr:gamma-glutamylcyclotransferase family protein [uncultured Lacinutrix sp.]